MNRRQKIIVSITGIFIVLLALVGLTYAYFLTQVTGNQNPKSISVTTADLRLVYDDVDDQYVIGEGEIIEPDTTFETKTFTVTNTGTETIDAYAVVLENVSITDATTGKATTLGSTREGKDNDFDLVITCKDQNGKDCSGYNDVLPEESKILITNSINPKDVHIYSAVLTYQETNDDQSSDMNKNIRGKFNIIDTKDTVDIEGTVTNTANVDYYVQTNSTKRISSIDSTGKYKVMGLETGKHTIKLCERHATLRDEEDNCSKPVLTREITVKTGETASGNNSTSTLTIKDGYRLANIGINANTKTTTISNEIKEVEIKVDLNSNPTLADAILNNAMNATGNATKLSDPETTPGQRWSSETERVLATEEDDYTETTGDPSYYFRGNVIDNYVTFADMCWRAVRIEGDGTVKLVLEDKNVPCSSAMEGNWANDTVEFGEDEDGKPDLINYNQGLADSFKTFQTTLAMKINKDLDLGFATQEDINNSLASKLKIDEWCYDDTVDSSGMDYGTSTRIESKTPSFICAGSKIMEFKDESPMYVGTLTADEVIFAGADTEGRKNDYLMNTYEKNNELSWWTLSPSHFILIAPPGDGFAYFIGHGDAGYSPGTLVAGPVYSSYYSRPAITLAQSVTATTNDASLSAPGTIDNPYVIN